MKREYETPELEIIRMAQADIITTSGDNDTGWGTLSASSVDELWTGYYK